MKAEVTLTEFKDLSYRAFYWTSFDPEKRGERTLKEHEDQLNDDLQDMPETETERYILNYKKYFSEWLSAQSNCASSAITGGSGFNVRRAEKANNREHAKYEQFIEWREKALKSIAKRIEQNKPEAQKKSETWARLESGILDSAATIHGINTGTERGYNKALFVSSIYKKVEVFAKHGDVEMVSKAIDCIRHFNETMGVVITERHKFFGLLEVAEKAKESLEEKATAESQESEINGVRVVRNTQADRLQLFFDGKPEPDMISKLKSAAFRWSPSNGCWQRQLTQNAISATERILK